MHDDQVIGSDTADALVQKILSNNVDAPSLHALLGDKDVKVAIISELRDAGVPAPGIVYRLLVFAFGGCERFLGGSIKSRLKAYIDNTPVLAGILQKILNLQHGAKAQAELKTSLLASLKDGKPINIDITADEASSLEMIIALHTAKQFEELDDHITKLGDELIKGFRDDLANQLNQMVAPELGWHDEVVSPENLTAFQQLMYTSGIDPFLGREDEIDLLHRFVGDPSFGGRVFNFRWMLLTGDAGVGKTRLAYEFTRKRLDDLWYKGKLDFASLKAFDNPSKWRPVKPTFIVIDYVQTVPEEVNALLLAFSTQAAQYEFPVRLLLLERSANPGWTDKLLLESGDKPIIEQHNFGGQSVQGSEISPLSSDSIIKLMERRIQIAQPDTPTPSRLLSLAKSVDSRVTSVEVEGRTEQVPTPRPLFAIATAEAIIDAMKTGQELPVHFERTKVLAGIVQRDRDMIWGKTVQSERERRKYEMGLAVATLAQGVSLLDLNQKFFGDGADCLPSPHPYADSVSLAAFGCCFDDSKKQWWWPPLEPDILGEFFVSEQLLDLDKDHRFALIKGALSLGERQAIIILLRMARDFPERLSDLQLEEVARTTVHEKILQSLTSLAVNLTGHGLDFGVAWRIFNVVLGREDLRISRDLGIEVSKAAVNICAYAGKAGDWARVTEVLVRLDALRKTFPDDQEIALEDAKSAFNISIEAGAAGDWGRVTEMLARIDALRAAFSDDQEIALVEAKTAFNTCTYAGKAGDWARVTEILVRLDALRKTFPEDQEIALTEAKAAFNISNDARAAYDWARVAEMLVRFDALRRAFPRDQKIALEEAKAAINISSFARATGDWGRITEALARLDALRADFSEDQEIARVEAIAAFNISNEAGAAGDWGRVAEMLVRLDALRKAFPRDREIALEEVRAAFNISNEARAAGDWVRVAEMLIRFDALRKAFPKDQEIALTEAKAAFNIYGGAERAGDWVRVAEMLVRIDALRKAFPKDQEIALVEANAAFSISDYARAAGDWVRVAEMLVRFDALRKAFPKDQKIALTEARGAVNISSGAGATGEWIRVEEMLARLDALRRAFPEDREIALTEAKAAVNISSDVRATGELARVEEMLARLDALREAFPEDQEIALTEAKAAVNICTSAGKAGDGTRVDDMLARLDALIASFGNIELKIFDGDAIPLQNLRALLTPMNTRSD